MWGAEAAGRRQSARRARFRASEPLFAAGGQYASPVRAQPHAWGSGNLSAAERAVARRRLSHVLAVGMSRRLTGCLTAGCRASKNFGSSAARAMSTSGIFTLARRIYCAASQQARWLPPRGSACCSETGDGYADGGADGTAGAARKAAAFGRLAMIRLMLRRVVASH